MSVPARNLVVGIAMGLVIGLFCGYSVAPEVGITGLEKQLKDLEQQVSALQSELAGKDQQIRTLESQVEDLQRMFGPIGRGTWNVITAFSGLSSTRTDYFYVGGTELRVNWTGPSYEITKWVDLVERYRRDFGEDSAYYKDAVDNLRWAERNVIFGLVLYR